MRLLLGLFLAAYGNGAAVSVPLDQRGLPHYVSCPWFLVQQSPPPTVLGPTRTSIDFWEADPLRHGVHNTVLGHWWEALQGALPAASGEDGPRTLARVEGRGFTLTVSRQSLEGLNLYPLYSRIGTFLFEASIVDVVTCIREILERKVFPFFHVGPDDSLHFASDLRREKQEGIEWFFNADGQALFGYRILGPVPSEVRTWHELLVPNNFWDEFNDVYQSHRPRWLSLVLLRTTTGTFELRGLWGTGSPMSLAQAHVRQDLERELITFIKSRTAGLHENLGDLIHTSSPSAPTYRLQAPIFSHFSGSGNPNDWPALETFLVYGVGVVGGLVPMFGGMVAMADFRGKELPDYLKYWLGISFANTSVALGAGWVGCALRNLVEPFRYGWSYLGYMRALWQQRSSKANQDVARIRDQIAHLGSLSATLEHNVAVVADVLPEPERQDVRELRITGRTAWESEPWRPRSEVFQAFLDDRVADMSVLERSRTALLFRVLEEHGLDEQVDSKVVSILKAHDSLGQALFAVYTLLVEENGLEVDWLRFAVR